MSGGAVIEENLDGIRVLDIIWEKAKRMVFQTFPSALIAFLEWIWVTIP